MTRHFGSPFSYWSLVLVCQADAAHLAPAQFFTHQLNPVSKRLSLSIFHHCSSGLLYKLSDTSALSRHGQERHYAVWPGKIEHSAKKLPLSYVGFRVAQTLDWVVESLRHIEIGHLMRCFAQHELANRASGIFSEIFSCGRLSPQY